MTNKPITPATAGAASAALRATVRLLTLILTALLLPVSLLSGNASAAGEGDPVLVGPVGTIAYHSAPDVSIDFSNAPLGDYEVTLNSDDYETYVVETVSYTGESDILTVHMSTGPLSSGWYSVDVWSYDAWSWTEGRFLVGPAPLPTLKTTSLPAAPYAFYPLVPGDGYADMTTVGFTTNRTARVIARVINSRGQVIRRVDLGNRTGASSWSWAGRKNDGTMASPGYFTIKITAGVTAAPAGTVSTSRGVKLATGYATDTVHAYRTGYNASSTGRSESCYVNHFHYSKELQLDCWGGSFASANYRFSIPASARNVTWGVAGYQGCCDGGVITKAGGRSSDLKFYTVKVSVTDRRSYTVKKVRVTYDITRRI